MNLKDILEEIDELEKDILEEEIDELIEELSAILENNDSQKDMKRAEELREEINYKKALLETI